MMRVYLDNVAACGRVVRDLTPDTEMEGLDFIESARDAGIVEIVTSREAWREQERTDRKSTRLNSSHIQKSRMPSSA